MINIEKIKESWYFEELFLEKWEVLFNEWDIDPNLYIIESWKLLVEKYTNNDRLDTKQLATLWEADIFWEGSLINNNKKQVRIVAWENSKLIFIEWKSNYEKFLIKNPSLWIKILASIIDVTNSRLLESNYMVTANFQLSKFISEIDSYNNKNLYNVLDEVNNIFKSKYLLYFEINPVVSDYISLKYDTRVQWKMQNTIIEYKSINDLKQKIIEEWIEVGKNNIIEELKLWAKTIWIIMIWLEDKELNDTIRKSMVSISFMIAGYLKQKQNYEELENKKYIQW